MRGGAESGWLGADCAGSAVAARHATARVRTAIHSSRDIGGSAKEMVVQMIRDGRNLARRRRHIQSIERWVALTMSLYRTFIFE